MILMGVVFRSGPARLSDRQQLSAALGPGGALGVRALAHHHRDHQQARPTHSPHCSEK